MLKPITKRVLEAVVTRAYVQLAHVSWDKHKTRIASLSKYGDYEVRLVEIDAGEMPNLWVELHVKFENVSIDSCSCDDLEATVAAAEHLIGKARQLSQEVAAGRGRDVVPVEYCH